MRNSPLEVRYFNTYYYANFVDNLLFGRGTYLQAIHDFFEDDAYLSFIQPFSKYTALHSFVEFCVGLEFYDDLNSKYTRETIRDGDPRLPINGAFEFYEIEHTTFREWQESYNANPDSTVEDQLCEYFEDIRIEESYEQLMRQITDEVFFIMFMNRKALLILNGLIAEYISEVTLDSLEESQRKHFARDGVLMRTHIPQWVRTAVYHRDRGLCAYCYKDITNLVNTSGEKHFDHIVPLAAGGINDITNIQLLCAKCNRGKGRKGEGTSTRYERWYPYESRAVAHIRKF